MFLGTDNFALKHFSELNRNRLEAHGTERVVDTLEVTVPCQKCAIERYSFKEGIKVHYWPLTIPKGKYDLGVIVSFGHLIPQHIIDAFPHGILNVHPSVLPKWRGASPIFHTLLAGDTETGITVMNIAATKFDVGPIVAQEKFKIPEDCTVIQLQNLAAEKGSALLLHCLKHLNSIEKKAQEGKSSYAGKLKQNSGRINWHVQTVSDIDRHYRALHGVISIRTRWKDLPIKLLEMVPPRLMQVTKLQNEIETSLQNQGKSNVEPGSPVYCRQSDMLCIRCKDGWAGFRKIVFRKPMTAKSFYNGYLSKPENKDIVFLSEENGLNKHWGK